MLTLSELADAYAVSREWNLATLGRIKFWVEELGSKALIEITEDDVDAALARLAARGKMKCLRGRAAIPTGETLKGSTVNRYITQLQSLYKFARRQRVIPRSFVAPTTGIEKAPEIADPNRFISSEQVERLIAAAKVTDRRWKKLPVFIRLLFDTGLRTGNAINLRWRDIDLNARTATVAVTKNGSPHIAALSARLVAELVKLPNKHPDSFVFANEYGAPYNFKNAFRKAARLAGLPHVHPHLLRHGCGAALAAAGISQAQIMLHLGHRSLGASARYTHLTLDDRRRVTDTVFG